MIRIHLAALAGLVAILSTQTSHADPPTNHPALAWGMPDTGHIIAQDGLVFSYDGRLRSARWVAERLTHQSVQANLMDPRTGVVVKRKNIYKLDFRIPVEFRAEDSDYVGADLDRGHLANSANHRSSQAANDDTFYFSNLSPQVGNNFNRHYWKRLEASVRDFSRRKDVSRLYVFTGPLFMPPNAPQPGVTPTNNANSNVSVTYKLIGANHVPQPTHYFKAVLAVADDAFVSKSNPIRGTSTKIPKIRIWAYVLPNEPIPGTTPIDKFKRTTDFLEHWAGFDLWSALADDIEQMLESESRHHWFDGL
jgi:endonuclease G